MAEINTADPTQMTVTFDELYVLESGGVDCFVLDWNEQRALPPYYVTVDGRRFGYTGLTYLVKGHGASLPKWVQDEEAAGHLTLFVERDDRLIAYVHDPAAIDEDEAAEAAVETPAQTEA